MANSRKRLFFALWPQIACRRAIIDRVGDSVRACRGRVVGTENLHLTLAFLGSVPVSLIPCIEAAAGRIHRSPFTITLSRLGHFGRSRILWLGPENENKAISPSAELAGALWRELAACGLKAEQHRFRPHVTLARKTQGSLQARSFEPIVWVVRDFVLVESVTGKRQAEYAVVRRFPLIGSADFSS